MKEKELEVYTRFPMNLYIKYILNIKRHAAKEYLNDKCIVFDFTNNESPFCYEDYKRAIADYISEPVEIRLMGHKCIVYKNILLQD